MNAAHLDNAHPEPTESFDFSVVIETENLDRESIETLLSSLESIDQQTLHPTLAHQALLMNAGQVSGEVVERIEQRYEWLTVVDTPPGTGYYELKMDGFHRTSSEIVVFLDSDVVFDPGCIESLVGFLRGATGRQIVCGETTIKPDSFYALVLLLSWTFPPRSRRREPHRTPGYPANQFAVRRSLLQQHPIPVRLDLQRGNCSVHARELARSGVAIWKHPDAGASHPLIPVRAFPKRLFFMGYHEISSVALAGTTQRVEGVARRLAFATWRIPRRMIMPFYRLFTLARNGDLPWHYATGAVPLAVMGSMFSALGMLYAVVRPGGARLDREDPRVEINRSEDA